MSGVNEKIYKEYVIINHSDCSKGGSRIITVRNKMFRGKFYLSILFCVLIVIVASLSIASAAEEINESSAPALSIGAGITPDSGFYFIEDKILSQFRNDLKNREKKIAEIEAMVKEGKIEDARRALERYNKYASKIEDDIDPEKSEEARRSSEAIRNKIKEIEEDVPEKDKREFIEEIEDREGKISTAAGLSKKIKDLCEALSKVDPEEYARICRTNQESPKWQKNLDKKLTEEQKKEAKEFFDIMSGCFENPRECKCEEIKVESFSKACNNLAPLAAECKDGNEEACEKMDEMEDPAELLPEHLRDVMQSVERRYSESKFDNHAPEECRKVGANTREECEKIMVRENAPEECIAALDAGKISFENPRQFQKACEEIMFIENAPEECIAAGLKDHKECGKYMFKQNAPEECIAAGLTGESSKDGKKCQEIMKSKAGENSGPGKGFALGRDCKAIENKDEKLKCFEEIFNSAQQQYGFPGKSEFGQSDGQGVWPEQCQKAGTLTRESCEKTMREESQKRFEESKRYQEKFASDCRQKGGRWDCGFGGVSPGDPCRCFFDEFNRQPREQFPSRQQPPQPTEFQCPSGMTKRCERENRCFCVPSEQQLPVTQPTQPSETAPSSEQQTTEQTGQTESESSAGSGESTGTESGSDSGAASQTGSQTESSSGGSSGTNGGEESGSAETGGTSGGTTGSVIGIDNPFLNYYFGNN